MSKIIKTVCLDGDDMSVEMSFGDVTDFIAAQESGIPSTAKVTFTGTYIGNTEDDFRAGGITVTWDE